MNFNINTNTNFFSDNGVRSHAPSSASDSLNKLLTALGNSDDPALQQLADDCTSSDAYDSSGATDEDSARQLLRQLRAALAEYRQSQQDEQGQGLGQRGVGPGCGFGASEGVGSSGFGY